MRFDVGISLPQMYPFLAVETKRTLAYFLNLANSCRFDTSDFQNLTDLLKQDEK